MPFPLDTHAHHLPPLPGTAIVNCYPETFLPQEGEWYSVGIHPWYIEMQPCLPVASSGSAGVSVTESLPAAPLHLRLPKLKEQLSHPQVLAVGEAGLDRFAEAPMTLQAEAFREQALLAEAVEKPLIIHLVRAVDELLQLRRALRPRQPWIIHGFRGKAPLAGELLKHGFFLSFGENYHAEALCATPLHRLLLETDESTASIETLLCRAASLRNAGTGELREALLRNIKSLCKLH